MTETLIIANENKAEAEFMARNFIDNEVKNRAYINALGAEIVVNYLSSNGVSTGELHNIHSISKILENIDIADILLPNIHIDVRVVFDEKSIFIPKSHFLLGIVPDIYVVLKLDKNFESVELLGYCESDIVNPANTNGKYLFVEKEKLNLPSSLISYVKNYSKTRERNISEDEMYKGRELSVSLSDHDISEEDFKYLLKLLLESDSLRNSLLEFDNFELLSYNAVQFLDMSEPAPIEESALPEPDEDYAQVEDFTQESSDDLEEEDSQDLIEQEYDSLNQEEEPEDAFEEQEEISDDADEDSETENDSIEDDSQNDLGIDDLPELSLDEDDLVSDLDFNEDLVSDELSLAKDSSSDNNSDASKFVAGVATVTGSALLGAGVAAAAVNEMNLVTATDQAIQLAGIASDAVSDMNGSSAKINLDEIAQSGEREEIFATDNELDLSSDMGDVSDLFEDDEIFAEDNAENEIEDSDNSSVDDFEDEYNIDEYDAFGAEENSLTEEPIEVVSPTEDEQDLFSQFANDNGIEDNIPLEDENVVNLSDFEQLNDNFETPQSSEDDLQNMYDISADTTSESMQESVVEPEPLALENSYVISNTNFNVGEIPIDINRKTGMMTDTSSDLENIYNNSASMSDDTLLNNDVRFIRPSDNSSGKSPIKAAGGALVALALIGALGFGVSKMINKDQEPEPITDEYVPENVQQTSAEDPNALSVDKDNVIDMGENTTTVTPSVSEKQGPQLSPTSYISVSKLSWEVPDYLSYSQDFRQYFQSAGRSLKVALSSDLLLATDATYSNFVKVSVSYDSNGGFRNARMVQSSGSSQIDKIVLQTVNDTLNVLKAPESLRNDESTTVILKIYF